MPVNEKPVSKPDILFISGSPRNRTSVALLDLLERAARSAGANTQRFLLSKKNILPCTGCDGCMKTGICILANKTKNGRFIDDYLELKIIGSRLMRCPSFHPLLCRTPAQLKAL